MEGEWRLDWTVGLPLDRCYFVLQFLCVGTRVLIRFHSHKPKPYYQFTTNCLVFLLFNNYFHIISKFPNIFFM